MPSNQQLSLDPALIAQQPQPTEAALEPQSIEWMLICCAHNPQLLSEARSLIGSHHFLPHESPLRLIWEAVCRSYDEVGGVTFETLAHYADVALRNDPNSTLTQQQVQYIFQPDPAGLIFNIAQPDAEMNDLNIQHGRKVLKQFAHERTVVDPLRRVMHPGFNAGIPANLPAFLKTIEQQQTRLSTLDSLPLVTAAPEFGSAIAQPMVFKATGIPFVDTPLGGQRVGDANGIIGVTGGGKTTLAVHMAASMANACYVEAKENGTEPELVVYITVEESAQKLWPRLWSAAFSIPREKLETMTDWNILSTQANMQMYEQRNQQDQKHPLSESERYQMGQVWLNKCFHLLDLSGSEEHPEAGRGGIDEIVGYVYRIAEQTGRRIRAVFIDYAGLVVEQYLQSQGGMDERNYRLLLKTFGNDCRKRIAEQFGTTCWIVHQLKGDVGKSSPIKLMHHTDAAESKDFAVNLAVCGCIGTPDPRSGCRRLNWSKLRYRPNEKVAPVTLKIHDMFATMFDASSLFQIDEAGRQFITRDDAREIGGTEAATQRQQAMTGPGGMRNTSRPQVDPNVVDEIGAE